MGLSGLRRTGTAGDAGESGRISAGKELPMIERERSLKERCAKFGAIISHLDLRALTKRQRQVAELRTAGLSLQAIAKRLGVTSERIRQIEARLRTRALLKRACAQRSQPRA
jgi:RNA polymerase sigma factor (sigma-70 family)